MLVIDAQVHIWGSGKPSGLHRQTSLYTAQELLLEMGQAGVDGAVLHPPSWDPNSNEMAIEAAKQYPDKFGILGWFPLNDPAQRKRIETWKQQPGMLGLRWSLTRDGQQTWHEDGTMDWLWPAAEKAGTPVATMAWRFLPLFQADRRAASAFEVDRRPLGVGAAGAGSGGVRDAGRSAAAGEASERGDQGDGRAGLFEGGVSVPGYPGRVAPDFRCVRSGAVFLGDGHHSDAVQLPAVRDVLHRGTALVKGQGPGNGDGPGGDRLVGMEAELKLSVPEWSQ